MTEPVARGAIVALPVRHQVLLATLAKEVASILRALKTEAALREDAPPEADFVVLLVEAPSDAGSLALPDLKGRAGAAIGFAPDAPEGRAAVARARRHLRAHGAALGARELVFAPEHFGHMGMESDAMREKLEILLRTLVVDAERLRLRREGWEDPIE